MKLFQIIAIFLIILLPPISWATATDFDWIKDFNIKAQVDPTGFRAKLAARFNIGDMQVKAVLNNLNNPAAAYIVLRLGEMSGRSTDYVIEKYRHNKEKGWGAIAKSLGIKPGSEEFHALKKGDDLNIGDSHGNVFLNSYTHENGKYAASDNNKGKIKNKK